MFNPFTSVPAILKILDESNKYLSHIPEFEAMREAGDAEGERALIQKYSGEWAANISEKLKFTYEIVGEENIPESGPIMIYADHQGLADILILYYVFRNHFQIGFVSKSEWKKIPILKKGVEYTRSLFLDRKDSRQAVATIQKACELLNMGFSLAIFPEGTRAKGPKAGEFKHGAFKFAQKANVPILPISLEGSYHCYEEENTYHEALFKVKIHPIVHIEHMNRAEQNAAFLDIEKQIVNGWKTADDDENSQ